MTGTRMHDGGPEARSSRAAPRDRLELERSRILTTILSAGAVVSGSMALLVPLWRENPTGSMIGYGVTFALHVAHLALVRAGRPLLVARSFTVLFFFLVTGLIYSYGGVRSLGGFVYPLVVLFAGLAWSGAAALGVAVAAALTAIGMSLMETQGLLTPVEPVSSGAVSAVITASVAMTAVMLVVALRVIRASSDQALANERKLRELERDLSRAQRMEALGKLAGGLAHDFNNMLTGIIGHAELVTLKASGDAGLKRHAQLILGTSERAAELTRQLLAFSRKREPFIGTVELNQLVKNVVAILEGSVDPRIQVQAELRAEPDWVEGDAASLESAILNLAINGRDAMPEGGTLSIRTARENGSVRLDVCDTGTGISSGVIDKIFEPYFTTKALGKGTGLGLAAVYGTTQEHGGTIEVESREGQGTRFILRLPCATGPPSPKGPRAEARTETGARALKVLAVDDEPAVLESVSGMLSQMGHAVLAAAGASEAFQILSSTESIDVVLLDLVIPGIPARTMLERIRELRPGIPILLTSGYSEELMKETPRFDLQAGFLRKPYRRAELAKALDEAIVKR
ncbi:MAG TPA: ATP-binding protein [Vicinamibacteria bacterium]|nr:ATP-binding protein [Vicinamibacteria bacterium]